MTADNPEREPRAQGPSTRGEPLEAEHLTDLGNARRLVRLFGNSTICYVPPWKIWLVWTGTHWQADETGEVTRLAKAVVAGIYAEAGYEQDPERRAVLARHAIRSESVRALQGMVTLAQTEHGIPVLPEQLDRDPWLLNVANGTLELTTGTLREHRREDLITKLIPIPYEPAAVCPTWLAFLTRIFNGREPLIRFLQRALGYSLTGLTVEQCLFVLWGTGDNGKTTLITTVMRTLASYAAQMAADTLLLKKGEAGTTALNDLATLHGARFVAACESDMGRRLAEALVKAITGGDALKVKRLYVDVFTIIPTFKLFLATNHRPQIRGTDHAIWRRIRLLPFDVRVPKAEQDLFLADKLAAEAPGILAWAVQGCLAWQREGLGEPDEVRNATATYRAEMDALADFLGDRCILEPDAKVATGDLYASYQDWAQKSGEKPMSQKAMAGYLTERGLQHARSKMERLWLGVRLRGPLDSVTDVTHGDPFSKEIPTALLAGGVSKKKGSDASPVTFDTPPDWVTGEPA